MTPLALAITMTLALAITMTPLALAITMTLALAITMTPQAPAITLTPAITMTLAQVITTTMYNTKDYTGNGSCSFNRGGYGHFSCYTMDSFASYHCMITKKPAGIDFFGDHFHRR